MVDSPRYSKTLIQSIEEMGGIDYIFLTHRDDVADAHKYASRFGAKRIIHHGDKSAQPDAEIVFNEEMKLGDFTLIPTPGHTKGHSCLLYKNFLFTGDHLYGRNG